MLWEEKSVSLQNSFLPTQPSSPDVYGLYKLLRMSPHSEAGAQTYHSLGHKPSCYKSIQTQQSRRQLRNTTTTILQQHWLITTSKYHTCCSQKGCWPRDAIDFFTLASSKYFSGCRMFPPLTPQRLCLGYETVFLYVIKMVEMDCLMYRDGLESTHNFTTIMLIFLPLTVGLRQTDVDTAAMLYFHSPLCPLV